MKTSPFLTSGKAIVPVCLTLLVVLALVVVMSVQNWTFIRFCWRGEAYYAQVAEACDQLLGSAEPKPRKLSGDSLKSLPPVLQGLDIDRVVVNTNVVMMMVGSGLISRQIIWKLAEDGSSWNLIAGNPETRKSRVVYRKGEHH